MSLGFPCTFPPLLVWHPQLCDSDDSSLWYWRNNSGKCAREIASKADPGIWVLFFPKLRTPIRIPPVGQDHVVNFLENTAIISFGLYNSHYEGNFGHFLYCSKHLKLLNWFSYCQAGGHSWQTSLSLSFFFSFDCWAGLLITEILQQSSLTHTFSFSLSHKQVVCLFPLGKSLHLTAWPPLYFKLLQLDLTNSLHTNYRVQC